VLLTGTPVPTPLVSFGIRRYGCVAGIVVTASHNPAADNGYKVYLGDGSQIIPPTDTQIAARIAAHPVDSLARLPRSDSYKVMCDQITRDYVARGAGLVPEGAAREITWVHTAMHGVGARTLRELTRAAGFPPAHEVPEQAEPDPDFPTVAFPNPEEPGAIDMALALAGRTGADLVVANDPDADRCAVAAVVDDRWRMLTGDELGLLLADHMIRRGAKGVLASSVVSSGALAALAAARGRDHVTTLTGFKWIGRVPDLAFGYEEAIGYCCDPGAVPDKDGLTAALMVLELAAGLRAEGLTLADRLDELTAELGLHATSQLAIRVSDLSLIADAMARLRENPPTSLLHAPVSYRDLAEGTSGLPPTDAVELSGDEVHVVVRPSGTEPKLKCYLEVRLTPERSRAGAAARLAAEIRMMALRGQMQSVLGLG
jgi:phosphoglucomutase/phosphomannomutase, alpha/beta/alpha domain II